ncbi:hypothetical protein Tco_0324512 [Tanacetum coccineum]
MPRTLILLRPNWGLQIGYQDQGIIMVPPSPDYIPGPEVPPSLDYIPGPEELHSPPLLDFVPEPISTGYVPEFDPRMEPRRTMRIPRASPPASPIHLLGYRATMIRLRAETPSTSHPLPLPTSSPPLQLSSSDHKDRQAEITLPPSEEVCTMTIGPSPEQDTHDIYCCIEGYSDSRPINITVLRHWLMIVSTTIEISMTTRTGRLVSREQAGVQQLQAADRRVSFVTIKRSTAERSITKALEILKGLHTNGRVQRQLGDPQKVWHSLDQPRGGCSGSLDKVMLAILMQPVKPLLPEAAHGMPMEATEKDDDYKYCPRGRN